MRPALSSETVEALAHALASTPCPEDRPEDRRVERDPRLAGRDPRPSSRESRESKTRELSRGPRSAAADGSRNGRP
jgi:hypothetical protein